MCTLFTGFGLGALLFQAALTAGFPAAYLLFGGIAALAATAVRLFATERPG